MSSYLAEVLSSAEKVELNQINSKCLELKEAVDVLKKDILSYLENIYVTFRDRPKQNKALADKLNHLQEEAAELRNSLEQFTKRDLKNAEEDISKHLDCLKRKQFSLKLVDNLYKIHLDLIVIRELQKKDAYSECMEKLIKVSEIMKSFHSDEELLVHSEFFLKIEWEKTLLLGKLSDGFNENITFESKKNKSVVRIKNENNTLGEIMLTLYTYAPVLEPLDCMIKFLWNSIFEPLLNCTTEVKSTTEEDFDILEVTIIDHNQKSSYVEVFCNIKLVLSFLSSNFNIALSEDLTTLNYIGRDIGNNLSEIIIDKCLQFTIPSTNDELEKYSIVVEATEELDKVLVMTKMFEGNNTSPLLQYVRNIDILYIDKKCQKYITMSYTHMKKDLHELVEVGVAEAKHNFLEPSKDFPQSSISQSILNLLQILENILTEAISSSEICAKRLVCTVEKICLLYRQFVPEYHKKFLQTIPQQIAVYYNNCMYLSYKLNEWNNTYLKKMPTSSPASFSDQGRQLSETALEMFTTFVDGQIKQIETIMKDAHLHQTTLEHVDGSMDKCLRQCLRQQELLKTVWLKVLPYTVYNKTLGKILNSLCNNIISAIVKCEDISSDAAEQLVELLKMIQTRGPKLFTDPKEVALFVELWYKLNELIIILNASLLDINDRWADGKGPLALQFNVNELRQLVRALFQNTERRAALLAKIHD